jgi:radial spoke head protein 4/6
MLPCIDGEIYIVCLIYCLDISSYIFSSIFQTPLNTFSHTPHILKVKPQEEEDEETMKTFTLAELKLPEAWVHAEIDIKSNGRCQIKPPPEEEEAEEKDLEAKRLEFFSKKPLELEPDVKDYKPVLRSIAEDVDSNGKSEWVVRTTPNAAASTHNTNVVAKSLKWPGAVSIASGFQAARSAAEKPRRRVSNIYVGFGVPSKASGKKHTPKQPSVICSEQPMMPDEQRDVTVAPVVPVEEE